MKARIIFSILALLLLNSCIVKSLHPFYTKDTVHFDKKFLGTWLDENQGEWKVLNFKKEFLKTADASNDLLKLSEEELKIYNLFNDGYIIKYKKGSEMFNCLGIPFVINNQTFIDFTPIKLELNESMLLSDLHFIPTHSLVKFDFLQNKNVSIKWFDEDILNELFEKNRIKIKHEKIGNEYEKEILLTDTPEKLQKFLEKYVTSNIENKWKTDLEFNLRKVNDRS